ncbi:PD40 domain-containing protein [Nafulsella turpanensis]|uniref:PD40 domain-containing protein n=1 Tax=Nafulsella turpanensis TaxID=1265690 RepID=UPI00034B1FC7|nr:PD40 domain-containing protein [Nafulsella turpanensis]
MSPIYTTSVIRRIFLIQLFLLLIVTTSNAQYFGRNKVGYKNFDFQVVETPNFKIYHYFESDSAILHLAKQTEKWYDIHQAVLEDTIRFKNPFIFYQNHADFQQTTAISGAIGIGTGGVTEGLKNRVVMPVFEANAQTDHVLGHEMVHAFQYNMLRDSRDSSLSLANLRNLPLWMVEGMAEYMSIGRVDAHTAMWMRDAYLNEDIPSIEDLNTNPEYFPYRYGQAFWAFIGGVWGEDKIKPLFIETARLGLEDAVDTVFGFNVETLSNMWQENLRKHYDALLQDTTTTLPGRKVLWEENAGEMNLAPSISPNGEYIMFLSELNIFTIDLFLADAETGEIIEKVSSASRNSHIDAFSYVESAGSWAPDSRRFAFAAFSKGRNKLIIVDGQRGETIEEYFIPGVPAFSNPAWSPDGEGVVVTGLVEGQSDLYFFDLEAQEVVQLTDDNFSDLQPSWSPDGRYIVFSTDRLSFEVEGPYAMNSYNLAVYDTEDGSIENLEVFPGADNMDPIFTPDNENIIFLSNRDGFRNLYRYDIRTGQVFQLTDILTGISGITEYSPAISISNNTGELVYSLYKDNKYSIYKATAEDLEGWEVEPFAVDFTAATLPPFDPAGIQEISTNLMNSAAFADLSPDSVKVVPYRPEFKLDYIGNSGVGVSAGRFGTGIAGGVNAIFSDILGNQQLYTALAINGEIYDFGGQVAYINQKGRLNWGGSISHMPYRTGRLNLVVDEIPFRDTTLIVDNLQFDILRVFEDKVSLFSYIPFSTVRRFEFGGAMAYYSYRFDRINNYYYGPSKIDQERERLDAPDSYFLQQLDAAYVGDNSFFGIASPVKGHRFRIGAETYFGELNFSSVLADYRRYFFLNPFTVAFRGYHYARYGSDAESNRLMPLFIGFPTLIHGYENVNLGGRRDIYGNTFSINELTGSRILVSNVEFRVPLTGPKRLALIGSRYLFTELNFFFDGGIAWDSNSSDIKFNAEEVNANDPTERAPVFSTGVGLRINVFGQLIIEPYYAFPLQRQDISGGTFGINFSPGW